MKIRPFARCSMLLLLPTLAAPGLTADPCQVIGHLPDNVTVLVGETDCTTPSCIQDSLSIRDHNYLLLMGQHAGTGADTQEMSDIKVGFDIPYQQLTSFRVFVDLKAFELASPEYHWYDEAVLVCAGEDVIDKPQQTICTDGNGTWQVQVFYFPWIPADCVFINEDDKKFLHVLWRASFNGEEISGEDDREVDRLVIDPDP